MPAEMVAGCRVDFHVASCGRFKAWGALASSSLLPCCFRNSSLPRIRRGWRVNVESASCQWSELSGRRRRRAADGGRPSRCNVVAQESAGTARVDNSRLDLANSTETEWTSLDSEALYRVQGWGSPYFFVSPEGHACVRLSGLEDGTVAVDLVELIESLKKRNVEAPLVIRFPDILNHRMKLLQDSFDSAILNHCYKSHFQGVFPVKCNHDRFLVEEVVRFGKRYQFGLEAGSKPEVLIAMAVLTKNKRALLICNGFKDRVYMESIVLARRLGIKAFVVVEQMEELDLVIKYSKVSGVRPLIGIRAKLSTRHNGHWGNTAGDNGKFGLTAREVVRVVYTLRHEMMLDCLQLLHFHVGSQIQSISTIKEAMREGSQLYCELALMGASMGYIDIGGGLGIDYDGTKGRSSASTNYDLQDYADNVVGALADACRVKGISHPVIVSESGRALASHHSVLVFEALSGSQPSEMIALGDLETLTKHSRSKPDISTDTSLRNFNSRLCKGEHLLSAFYEVYQLVNGNNYQKALSDAKQLRLEAGNLFKLGSLSLEQRAKANALYDAVCHRVLEHVNSADVPEELQSLQKSMVAVYHVNFSLFRSAPDLWAISQIYPIIPLQRLNERPAVAATLADLTCDSDGIVDCFVGGKGTERALPVHALRHGEQYYLGLFLAGVYQEGLGSAHNLFGTTNTAHVRTKALEGNEQAERHNGAIYAPKDEKERGYTIEHVIMGQTTGEVLSSMHHDVTDMMEHMGRELDTAVADGCISAEEGQSLLRDYNFSLVSYTYLTRARTDAKADDHVH